MIVTVSLFVVAPPSIYRMHNVGNTLTLPEPASLRRATCCLAKLALTVLPTQWPLIIKSVAYVSSLLKIKELPASQRPGVFRNLQPFATITYIRKNKWAAEI